MWVFSTISALSWVLHLLFAFIQDLPALFLRLITFCRPCLPLTHLLRRNPGKLLSLPSLTTSFASAPLALFACSSGCSAFSCPNHSVWVDLLNCMLDYSCERLACYHLHYSYCEFFYFLVCWVYRFEDFHVITCIVHSEWVCPFLHLWELWIKDSFQFTCPDIVSVTCIDLLTSLHLPSCWFSFPCFFLQALPEL